MRITVRSLADGPPREIEVPDAVFAYPYKEHLIHTAVRAYLALRRRGTHSTKARGEVSGSGRKLWRQKGTGRARVGSLRSPLWRKGGVAHGPKPHGHAMDLSAGEKRNALKSALSRKLMLEGVVVVDTLDLDNHKTAALERQLAALGVGGKTLLVDRLDNEKLRLAARNNPRLKTVDALALNVYDVVDRGTVVFSERALDRVVEVLGK